MIKEETDIIEKGDLDTNNVKVFVFNACVQHSSCLALTDIIPLTPRGGLALMDTETGGGLPSTGEKARLLIGTSH